MDLFKNHPITQDMHDLGGVNIIVLHMRSGLQKGAFSYSAVEMVCGIQLIAAWHIFIIQMIGLY